MNNAAGQVKTINLPVSEHFVANSGNNPCVICGREQKPQTLSSRRGWRIEDHRPG